MNQFLSRYPKKNVNARESFSKCLADLTHFGRIKSYFLGYVVLQRFDVLKMKLFDFDYFFSEDVRNKEKKNIFFP